MIFAYECNNASSNDIFTLNFALQWLKSCQEDLAALLCDSHTTVNLVSRCKGLAATLFVVKETLSKKSVSKLLTNETKWKFPIQQLHNLLIYQISAVQSLILDLVNTASDKYGGIVNASHAICSLTVCSILSIQVVTLCPFIPESVDALLHSNGLPLHLRLLQECFQKLKNYSRNSKPETNALSHIQKTHIFQLFALIVEDEVDDSFSVTMDCRNTSEIFACKAMLATNIRSLISIPGQLLKLDAQKILPLLAPMLQFCMGVIEQYNIIEDSDSIDSGLNKEVATSAVLLLSDVVKTLTVTNAAATNTDEISPFFSSDRIEMLLKNLLEKLLVIDRAELDHWGKDPHQFFADQIMLTEGVCVRAAAEGLFYGLLELYPDYVTNTMLTLLGNNREQIDLATVAQKELGCNTVVGVWVSLIFVAYYLKSANDPCSLSMFFNTPFQYFLQSSVYLCAGLGAAVLFEKMDSFGGAQNWIDKLIRPLLSCLLERNHYGELRSFPDGSQVLAVRVLWMLSVWMSLVFRDIEYGNVELVGVLANLVQDICKFICYAAQSVSQNSNITDVVVVLYGLQALDAVVKIPQFRLDSTFSVTSIQQCSKFSLQQLLQALCHLCHSSLTNDAKDLGEMGLAHICLDLLAELYDLLSVTTAGLRPHLYDEENNNQACSPSTLNRSNRIHERPPCADIVQQSVENILQLWVAASSTSNKMILPHIIKVASKVVIASALGGSTSTTYTEIFHFQLLHALLPLLRDALLLSASKRMSLNLMQQSMCLWLSMIRLTRWSTAEYQRSSLQQEDCVLLQQTREQLIVLLQEVLVLQCQVVVHEEDDDISEGREEEDGWLVEDEEYSTAQQLTDLLLVLEAYCISFADYLLDDSPFATAIRGALVHFYCGEDRAGNLSEWVMGRGVGGLLGEVGPSLVWVAVRPLESLLLVGPATAAAWIHNSGVLNRLLLFILAAPAHGSHAWEERCSFAGGVWHLMYNIDFMQPAIVALGQVNQQLEALCEADVAVVHYLTVISRVLLANPSLVINSLQLLWEQIVPSQSCDARGYLPALSVVSIVGELLRRFDTIDYCPGAVIRRRLWQAAIALQQRMWQSFSFAVRQLRELQNAIASSGSSAGQQSASVLEKILICCEAVSADHGGDDSSYEEATRSAVQELLGRDGSSSEGLLYAMHPNEALANTDREELRVDYADMEPLVLSYYHHVGEMY
eukprot:gene22363-30612_t